MHVIAGKAVAFKEALEPEFKTYQAQVVKNAKAMAATFIERGYKIVSGGTDNHLMLVDLIGTRADRQRGRCGPWQSQHHRQQELRAQRPALPFVTSGVRIGTPAITRRGFKEAESIQLTNWICDVLDNHDNDAVLATVREQVLDICRRFPVYA